MDNQIWRAVNRVELPSTILPEQTAKFSFSIIAPQQAGKYPFQWGMVRENVAWFGPLSSALEIQVSPALASSQTTLAANTITPQIGQTRFLTANVSGNSPTGSVSFYSGASNLGSATHGVTTHGVIQRMGSNACHAWGQTHAWGHTRMGSGLTFDIYPLTSLICK